MKTAATIVITLLVFFAVYFFVYWLPLSLIPRLHQNDYLPQVVSLAMALASGVFIWKKTATATRSFAVHVLKGGMMVGSVGFLLGFLGPLLLNAGGNQGPLLGIFITGPIGFVLGLVGGAVYWMAKRKGKIYMP